MLWKIGLTKDNACVTKPENFAMSAGLKPFIDFWRRRLLAERLLVAGMLAVLCLPATFDSSALWVRASMLVHLGLFLLWQPFMRRDGPLSRMQLAFIGALAFLVLVWFNAYLLAIWVCLIAGVVGGRIFLFETPWRKRYYLLAFIYLVNLLVMGIVPHAILHQPLQFPLVVILSLGVPVSAMLLLPLEAEQLEGPQLVDLFYAAILFMLLVAVVLGAMSFMTLGGFDYVPALVSSLLVFASALIGLSIAWNPQFGVDGLSLYFSRHVLSIGLPVDRWLRHIADLSLKESEPETFLHLAAQSLQQIPGVSGVAILKITDPFPVADDVEKKTDVMVVPNSGVGQLNVEEAAETRPVESFGLSTAFYMDYTDPTLQLRLYGMRPFTPLLVWHFNLLCTLMSVFFLAKLGQKRQQQQAYEQLMHETGARISHDVKNLLQVLAALTEAGDQYRTQPESVIALLGRQLPAISQRLQHMLEQFRQPNQALQELSAQAWWESLITSHKHSLIYFELVSHNETAKPLLEDRMTTTNLPMPLFDSAAENLIANALSKRKSQKNLQIWVRLDCSNPEAPRFDVTDDGEAVSQDVAEVLMRRPVISKTGGQGVGLYQLTRMAKLSGYELELTQNQAGCVRFTLRSGRSARSPQTD